MTKITRKELIDLGLDIEDAIAERERLGDFDPNSKHMLLLLRGLTVLVANEIENMKPLKKGK